VHCYSPDVICVMNCYYDDRTNQRRQWKDLSCDTISEKDNYDID